MEVVNMEGKIVRDGLFKVYPNGLIYKKKNGVWEKAHIFENQIKNSKYQLVTTYKNKKQIHANVSRLIAEAFIPNPENKQNVAHLDGDSSNNSIDNLVWVTPKERAQMYVDMGRGRKLEDVGNPCIICGGLTASKNSICPKCKKEKKLYEEQLARLEKIKEKFKDIDIEGLSKRNRIIVEMRLKDKTLQEIGDRLGITRERVRQIEERILSSDIKSKDAKEIIGKNEININEIRGVRNMLGVTKTEISTALSISTPTYLKMEKNPLKFRIEHIHTLENVFDIKINIR